jgi:hypothetical protein
MAEQLLTESYDFVQKAVGKVVELVEALADYLHDDDLRKLLLADLGLNPNSGAQLNLPEQNLNSIRTYLARTDTNVEAFLTVVDDLHQVSEAIISFIEVASADPTTEDGLRELAFELFMLSSLLHYRYQYPAAVALGEALGIINYGLEEYGLMRLLWDRVVGILRTIGELDASLHGASSAEFQSEAHARSLSDALLLPLAVALTVMLDLKEKRTSWRDTEILYGWDIVDPDNPTSADTISNRILSTNFSAKFKGSSDKLFSVGAVPFADQLDNRVLSSELRGEFQANGKALTDQAVAVVQVAGSTWGIVDIDSYTIEREGDTGPLHVFSEPSQNELSVGLGIGLVPRDDGGPGVFLALGAGGETKIPLSTKWQLHFKGKAPTAASIFLNFDDLSDSRVFGPADAGVSLDFVKTDKYLQRRAQLPDIAGTTFSFGGVSFGVEVTAKKLEFRVLTKNNTLIISGKSADNFIRKSLPAGEIRADFDLGVAFDAIESKFRFTDGTKLKVVLPLGKEVLGVRFVYITLEIAPSSGSAESHAVIEISGSLSIKWGPFTSTIDRLGLLLKLPPPKDASGDRDWSEAFTFKPPTGVGFAIDTDVVSGGGFLFFDRATEEYAGVLQLKIAKKFDLKAIGLITTKLGDGQQGFSIIAIASVEFDPGYQLFWGFTLDGVGLLVGVNRAMVLDVLRAGVRNGTLDGILFPKDPVRNAPKIISDLRSVFPATLGRHVFGFLLFMSWAGQKSSFKLKLGVVLEVPAPVKLVILGQLEIYLPTEKAAIVVIKCDIVGIWDQAAQTISVDAALRDSKVGEFPLTGEMAVRGSWGEDKVFIISVGGVHPAFNPPAALPALKRVQIALGTGDNPRLRLLGYLAITSNTFQVGARAELHARASGFTLEGWAGIDALFQFDPFKVIVDFSAGVEIKRGSRVLFSLTLKATLEAFTPIRIHGKVKFKIFFVSFSIPVNLELGETKDVVLAAVNVLDELISALNDANNWAGELSGRRELLATLQEAITSSELMVHPLASLSVRQQVVPLGIEIQVYKNARPSGDRRFEITSVAVNGTLVSKDNVEEFFAPAQFFEMSDDEKLAQPSFEAMSAGVIAGDDDFTHGVAIPSEVTYETILIDHKQDRLVRLENYFLSQEVFVAAASFGSAGQAPGLAVGAGKYRAAGLGIQISEPAYTVATVDDLTGVEGITVMGSYAQVLAALRAHQAQNGEDARHLQVVGLHEQVTE